MADDSGVQMNGSMRWPPRPRRRRAFLNLSAAPRCLGGHFLVRRNGKPL